MLKLKKSLPSGKFGTFDKPQSVHTRDERIRLLVDIPGL